MDVPIEELERRDTKFIYQNYRKGLIKNVVGLDVAVDLPESPDFAFKFDPKIDPATLAQTVVFSTFKR